MKASTVSELKHELSLHSQKEVMDLCLRLARFKKENKELLTYLLFESENEAGYVTSIKEEITEKFNEIPSSHNLYLKIKMFRKILRSVNKYNRYSGETETEVQLLLYFCRELLSSGVRISKSQSLTTIFESQLKKIAKSISQLHEDLQFDYRNELEELVRDMK